MGIALLNSKFKTFLLLIMDNKITITHSFTSNVTRKLNHFHVVSTHYLQLNSTSYHVFLNIAGVMIPITSQTPYRLEPICPQSILYNPTKKSLRVCCLGTWRSRNRTILSEPMSRQRVI